MIQTDSTKTTLSLLNSAANWISSLVVYPLNKANSMLQTKKASSGLKLLKEMVVSQGARGIYRGALATPMSMLPTFLSTYLYESVAVCWRNNQSLRQSRAYKYSPLINTLVASVPSLLLSTPISMLMTLVHSEKLKISDAVTRLRAKQLKTFLDMYKANLVSMSIFFGIRQQMFENQHVYPWKLSHDQTIMLTAVISSIAANLIYQPLETLQSRLVVDTKSSLRSVISSNISNLSGVKSLFRGFTTKTVSTSVFNCVYLPMYASLKGKFNSF